MGLDTNYGGSGGGEDDSVYSPSFLDSLSRLFAQGAPQGASGGGSWDEQAPPPPAGYGQVQSDYPMMPRQQPMYGAPSGGYGRYPGGPGPSGPWGGQNPRSGGDERRAWWAQNQNDSSQGDPRRQDGPQPDRAPARQSIVYAPDGTPLAAGGTTPAQARPERQEQSYAPARYGQPQQPWRRRTRYGGMPPGGPMGGGPAYGPGGAGYGGAALPPTAGGYQV